MKKYNVGIIGYGWVATAHIDAINSCSNAQVIAVYSSRELDGVTLSSEWGSPIQTYTDLDEMLKDADLHVVSICSYPYQHKEHAIRAAKAGKHLIIEKPLALSWEDCQEIEQVSLPAIASRFKPMCFMCFKGAVYEPNHKLLMQ